MNIKDNGKSKRDKAESKAIIGIVLATIMLASVFAGISASAVADNNTVDDSGVVESDVEEEGVIVSVPAGTVTVSLATDSPSANIANESANFTNIFKLQFSATGESANITQLVIAEEGTIHGTTEITGVGVNTSEASGYKTSTTFSGDNGTATLTIPGGYQVPVGSTLKDLYVWVNTTDFDLGDTLKLTLTSFSATGLASGESMTTEGTPLDSDVIAGAGKLTVANGPHDVATGTVINAGENTTGTVLMQLNFTATIGACILDNITLTENGTANGTTDFSAIYLVNDTDNDGVWDKGTDPIKGTPATTFSAENGTATITDIDKTMPLNSPVYMLVVVNTTNQFWSGDTLAVNISATTDVIATSSGIQWGITGTPSSNVTTGQAKIQVTAGSNQTYLSYVLEGERGLVESAQLTFTAIGGLVNITQLTLEQHVISNWKDTINSTYPKIFIDEDGDGNVTSYDTPLDITAGNFSTDNVTLVSNFTSYNSSGEIDVDDPTNITEVFTGWGELTNGTTKIYWYNTSLINETTGMKCLNISVNYTDSGGSASRTFINYTDARFNDSFYGKTWIDVSGNFTDGVRSITNMTFKGTSSSLADSNISSLTGQLVAWDCVVNVSLGTNITIGTTTESTAGQASKSIIIAVNTTSDWKDGNRTEVLPNKITAYGNCSNYIAYDNTTGSETRIYQNNDPSMATISELRARTILGHATPVFLVKIGDDSITANVGKNTNLSPVLQLNFSYTATVDSGASSSVYIREITISTNGTVNESSNVTACLVIDADNDGAVGSTESVIATAAYTSNNQTVKLTPSSAITLTLDNEAGVDSVLMGDYTNVLVAVNTTSDIVLSKTLQFYLANTSRDYTADTGTYMVVNETNTEIAGSQLTVAGTIAATRTNAVNNGKVSTKENENFVELMQLKFTAGSTEDVNITSVNVTWNGTGAGSGRAGAVGIINDTDADGVWDVTDPTEIILNESTFSNNLTFLNLSYNDKNITVPAGESRYALIYVNTTAAGIDAGDTIRVNITADPYLNYTAYGTSSNVSIADLQTTTITSATMTAAWTGNVTSANYNLSDITWVEGAQTDFPVLGMNFSAANETLNISSIRLTASGSVNDTNNVTLKLVEDSSTIGAYDDEPIIATATIFAVDNGNVTLIPSPEIQVTSGSYKNVLVVADISTNVQAGEVLTISLSNPSTDYVATGYYSETRIQDQSTTAISNTTYATGNVTVSAGTNNTIEGPVTAMNDTLVAIMQLNFSATPAMEDINITGINLTAADLSSDAQNDTWSVGIFNDTNGNGVWDTGEVILGESTFDANNTAVFTFGNNLTINGTASQTWANVTFNNTVVYVNTSDNFNVSDHLKIKLVTYNATGVSSGQTLDAFGVTITSNKLTGTGNITAEDGADDVADNTNITAGANTSIVVWQLKLTAGTAENITINNITITENGTVNGANDIASIYLVNDTDADGVWNMTAGDSGIIASGIFGTDNGTVTLAPTANNTITNDTSINYLVVVNTTATFYEGETLEFHINRSTTNGEPTRLQGIYATGDTSGIVVYNNFFCQFSNTTIGYCTIDVYDMTQPTTTISNESDNLKDVLKLNFSAPAGAVNITNITLKENGTATEAGIENVSVWFDDTCYNSTISWPASNATLTLNLSHPTTGLGMIVNGTTKVVTIKVNTTASIATDQTIKFEFNRSHGTGYNATCNVSAHAPYSNETGEINNSITVTAAVAEVDEIDLKTDWNLISLWLIPTSTSIDTVTAAIETNLYGVYSYDTSTETWTSYFPSDGVSGSSLKTMTAGYGYWIKMTGADTLPVSGNFLPSGTTTPPSYPMYSGWNLIGFHSENTTTTAADYFGTQGTNWQSIFEWDAATQSYTAVKTGTVLAKGEGYWVAGLKSFTVYPI